MTDAEIAELIRLERAPDPSLPIIDVSDEEFRGFNERTDFLYWKMFDSSNHTIPMNDRYYLTACTDGMVRAARLVRNKIKLSVEFSEYTRPYRWLELSIDVLRLLERDFKQANSGPIDIEQSLLTTEPMI